MAKQTMYSERHLIKSNDIDFLNMNIRNFSIIAHIDHGKSTLADRILEYTGTISKRDLKDRVLDTLELEQEKGITIKLQTARMKWKYTGESNKHKDKTFILNLLDTPGHVDFSYEVSRSIAASEGVILLVDATQGIQAQTISNFYKAVERNLEIIPVISKIDLPQAEIEKTKISLDKIFGYKDDEIILTSGKTGEGVEKLLNRIIEKLPEPKTHMSNRLKALIFDSFYHEHKGVVALVKVVQGSLSVKEALQTVQTNNDIAPIEVGYLKPKLFKMNKLNSGDVGYIATGLKDIKKIHVGDTIIHKGKKTSPFPGYEQPKPMVYASLYPLDTEKFQEFSESLEKLALNDAALTYTKETSPILGTGFCCGFLGLLHLEITQERLSREFDTEVFTSTPSVLYKIKLNSNDPKKLTSLRNPQFDKNNLMQIRSASEFPRQELIAESYEPYVKLEIITPSRYLGPIMELTKEHRGIYIDTEYLTPKDDIQISDYLILRFEIPTAEIIINFFDKLKSISQGYASMDYEHIDHRLTKIVKVSVLVNYEAVEALSFISFEGFAQTRSKTIVEKLSEVIPRQQFQVPIQAAISGKVIARSDIRAFRKDVTQKLYGGDVTRKKKLLEKQKKGKKRMKEFGKVEIPREAFLAVLRND